MACCYMGDGNVAEFIQRIVSEICLNAVIQMNVFSQTRLGNTSIVLGNFFFENIEAN